MDDRYVYTAAVAGVKAFEAEGAVDVEVGPSGRRWSEAQKSGIFLYGDVSNYNIFLWCSN